MDFIWIPPGKFRRGGDGEREFEVTLSRGFWLGKTPVTQAQYEILMGNNPSHFKKSGGAAPVESVNWEEATACCRRVGELLASAGGGEAVLGRLPTEAEWEYACRAGTQTQFSFSDDEAQLGDHAWYGENSGGKTHPVGQKKPNAWGLHDMHGNVWEWCQDGRRTYTKEAQIDPVGPTKSDGSRVLRGGSWGFNDSGALLSSFRGDDASVLRINGVGFRCVLVGVSSR